MDATQKLVGIIGALLLVYFGAAAIFVSQSEARVRSDANPARLPVAVVPAHLQADSHPGHFRLQVKRDPTRLTEANRRLIATVLQQELQRRFGEVQVLAFGQLAENEQFGWIQVEVETWTERPYEGPVGEGPAESSLPTYVALRLLVRSSVGVAWGGVHHLNAIQPVPGAENAAKNRSLRTAQVRMLVKSMLNQMPPVRHHYKAAGD